MCSEGVVSVIFHVMMENKQGVMARKDIDLPIAYASTAFSKAELQCSPMEHGFSLISIPANVSPLEAYTGRVRLRNMVHTWENKQKCGYCL